MARTPGTPHFLIRVQGQAEDYPPLIDVSSFLWDFNQAYEISRVATDQRYAPFVSSEGPRDPRGMIEDEDRLQVVALNENSPLVLLAIVAATPAAVGAIWGLVQIVDKITNWPLNRQILKLQRDKLRSELQRSEYPIQEFEKPEQFRQHLRDHEVSHLYDHVAGRLEFGKIRVTDFEITLLDDFPRNQRGTDVKG